MRWGRLNRKRRRRANRWVITIESARLSLNGGDGGDERGMMRGETEVQTIGLGRGTPSLLPETLTEVLDCLTSRLLHPRSQGISIPTRIERGAIATSRKLESLPDSLRTSRSRPSTNPTKEQSDQVKKSTKKSIETLMREGKPIRIERIPKNDTPPLQASFPVLTKESVEKVLDEIDSGSRPVPKNRNSTNWCLVDRGRHYPPKYVLHRARKIQGTKRRVGRGGPGTNIQLQNLDYVVIEDHCGGTCNFSH